MRMTVTAAHHLRELSRSFAKGAVLLFLKEKVTTYVMHADMRELSKLRGNMRY